MACNDASQCQSTVLDAKTLTAPNYKWAQKPMLPFLWSKMSSCLLLAGYDNDIRRIYFTMKLYRYSSVTDLQTKPLSGPYFPLHSSHPVSQCCMCCCPNSSWLAVGITGSQSMSLHGAELYDGAAQGTAQMSHAAAPGARLWAGGVHLIQLQPSIGLFKPFDKWLCVCVVW